MPNKFVLVSILSSLQLALRYPTPQSCCIKKLLSSIWLKSVDKTVKNYKENWGGEQFSALWVMTHLIKNFAPEIQFQPNRTCCQYILIEQIYFIKYCIQSYILIRLNIVITKKIYSLSGIHIHFYSWPFCPFNSDNLICNKNFEYQEINLIR